MAITVKQLTGLNDKELRFVVEYVKDCNARRAAVASGACQPDSAYTYRDKAHVRAAINKLLSEALEAAQIDAEWLIMELVDNHRIARLEGNLSASNSALNTIAKHKFVDAFAADKVQVIDDKEIMSKLIRGRERVAASKTDKVEFF